MSMNKELWLPIKGYEGLYEVSNTGYVRSIRRNNKLLKYNSTSYGYKRVGLYKDGKQKFHTIHRLVAEAFIPNDNLLPEINHIDGDKQNNHVDNLEYCTAKYNINHGTHNKRVSEKLRGRKHSEEHIKKMAEKLTNHPKKSKPVFSVDKVTEEIKEYPDRIIGIVSEIPDYETWGSGNDPVNGRIWIKVK